jgi:hypothetical protein
VGLVRAWGEGRESDERRGGEDDVASLERRAAHAAVIGQEGTAPKILPAEAENKSTGWLPYSPRMTAPLPHIFSVDVEEYFQVLAFERAVPRAEWDRMPSRVEASVDQLLELLARHDATGTFFTVGWLADLKSRRIAGGTAASPRFGRRSCGRMSAGAAPPSSRPPAGRSSDSGRRVFRSYPVRNGPSTF